MATGSISGSILVLKSFRGSVPVTTSPSQARDVLKLKRARGERTKGGSRRTRGEAPGDLAALAYRSSYASFNAPLNPRATRSGDGNR
jgi:hypothetical protein